MIKHALWMNRTQNKFLNETIRFFEDHKKQHWVFNCDYQHIICPHCKKAHFCKHIYIQVFKEKKLLNTSYFNLHSADLESFDNEPIGVLDTNDGQFLIYEKNINDKWVLYVNDSIFAEQVDKIPAFQY